MNATSKCMDIHCNTLLQVKSSIQDNFDNYKKKSTRINIQCYVDALVRATNLLRSATTDQ